MDNSPYHDSPYADEHTSTRDKGKQPSASNFEAEAAKIRARMPYRPPSPPDAPLSRDAGISAFTNGINNGFPQLVRDAPTSRLPNQMTREGPRPRAPGETRDLDFYERLTPRNQRLFKFYGATALFGLIGFASVVYSAWNIHFMKIFSPKAKEVMMVVYELNGYGGMVIILLPALLYAISTLIILLRQSSPILEIYSSILSAIFSIGLTLFTILTFFAIKNQGQDHAIDGEWDPCLAPGADKWKRLPCGKAKDEIWGVQMTGLGALAVASVLYSVLALVHFAEAKSGGGSLFSRQKGYVRLEQNSLNPYEVHDAYEDEEPRGRSKP